jgi:hypothetical protein
MEGGKSVSARYGVIDDYPWRGRKQASGEGSTTVRVTKGRYTRNADMGNTALTLDCGANEYLDVTVGANEYLSAVIVRDNLNADPRLSPTSVILKASTTSDNAAVAATLSGQYYGGHVVIGKNTDSVWEQRWKGGDITDDEDIGDTDDLSWPYRGHAYYSIEKYAFMGTDQVRNFSAGTPSGALTEQDLVFVRVPSLTETDTKYATPAEVVAAGGGYTPDNPQPLPPHDHTDDEEGGTLDHKNLADIGASANGGTDDHCGDAAAIVGEVRYIHAAGTATRNAMSGVIGDGSNVQSIAPTARTLDGESDAGNVGWQITSEANSDFNGWTKGALIVAGGVTVKKSVKADVVVTRLLDASQEVFCSGTADVSATRAAIETSGGIKAGKTIQAGLEGYKCGSSAGITDAGPFILTRSDGTTLNVKLAGGIIVPA